MKLTKSRRLVMQLSAGCIVAAATGCAVSTAGGLGAVNAAPSPVLQAQAAGDEQNSAGALLKRAFDHFKADENAQAAELFRAAIATGNLNDAGRALAYWHVYVCEETEHHPDAAAEALVSFVVVAQDVIQVRNHLRYAEDDGGDFVDRFDLKHRLTRARATLSAAWAGHMHAFGHSAAHPVLVHSEDERDYFLELTSACETAGAHPEAIATQTGITERVDITCTGQTKAAKTYFFMTVPDVVEAEDAR